MPRLLRTILMFFLFAPLPWLLACEGKKAPPPPSEPPVIGVPPEAEPPAAAPDPKAPTLDDRLLLPPQPDESVPEAPPMAGLSP